VEVPSLERDAKVVLLIKLFEKIAFLSVVQFLIKGTNVNMMDVL